MNLQDMLFVMQGKIKMPYSIKKRCLENQEHNLAFGIEYIVQFQYIDEDIWDFILKIKNIENIDKNTIDELKYLSISSDIIDFEISKVIENNEVFSIIDRKILKMELFI